MPGKRLDHLLDALLHIAGLGQDALRFQLVLLFQAGRQTAKDRLAQELTHRRRDDHVEAIW